MSVRNPSRTAPTPAPSYGEVWRIAEATVAGVVREADAGDWLGLVVSSDAIGVLPSRIVAAIVPTHERPPLWQVAVTADPEHADPFIVDTSLLQTIDAARFDHRIGRLSADVMSEVAAAIALLVEYDG